MVAAVAYLHDKSFFSAVRSIPSDDAADVQFNQHKKPLQIRKNNLNIIGLSSQSATKWIDKCEK